jgi:hypothetical protein
MKALVTLLLLFPGLIGTGQKLIKGVIIDSDKKTPIPAASIFLNNTSIGTTASMQGTFELTIPTGKYELIVSSVGFETHSQTITAADVSDFITIKLAAKAKELENVVLEPYEKDGWQKWGRFFMDMFIGTSINAANCKLLNSEVIRFRNSKKTGELLVTANEPLVIENKALGYTVRYQLEGFTYHFKNRFLFYYGYPFFEEMSGTAARKKRWQSQREEVYFGSVLHFMRSVYRNTLLSEGFQVRRLQKIVNTEKERVKKVYADRAQQNRTSGSKSIVSTVNSDSTDYYSRVLQGPDYKDIIGKNILPGDSIAGALDNITAELSFPDYLLVIYTKKLVEPEYKRQYPDAGTAQASQLTLLNNKTIEIQANGSYYNPTDLMQLGYWSWSEKMATMLPYDFKPGKRVP